MTNEEFQTLVLEQLTGLNSRMDGMQQEITGIKQEITGIKQDVTGLKQDMAGVKQEVTGIKHDVTGLNRRMDGMQHEIVELKQEMVTKSDMAENTAILRALENRTDIISAEIEGLKHATVSKAAFDRVETKIDILSHRISAQDGEIRLLKLAK